MSLIEELQRRHVVRVGIAYAIAGWLVIQVADVVTESFAAPEWVMKTLIAVVLLGFVIALALAWAFQLSDKGIKRESDATDEPGAPTRPTPKLNTIIIVLLTLAVTFLMYERVSGPSAPGAETREQLVEQPEAQAGRAPQDASVAVLPFINMSGNAENEYFSDGLTETLLHMLAQVKDLKVAARTSSFAFKGKNTDIREIAKQLDVAHVLEGSVQRAGNTVRITAQLIQAADGYHLWSQTFDRQLDDIFSVQDEIARDVASALKGSLLQESQDSAVRGAGTQNTEAYDLYLRGMESYWKEQERSALEAERLMRQAIALDPDFALAWSGLSLAMIQHASLSGSLLENIADECLASARRAVELAPDDPTTLSVLGETLRRVANNLIEAKKYLERAVALHPNNAQALVRLSDVQFSLGEFALSVETASRAMALDPLDFSLKADSTHKFFNVGRLPEAEMLAKAVIDNNPGSVNGLSALGNLYWRSGRHAQALATYQEMLQINPNTAYIIGRISASYRNLEDFESAERWVEKAEAINPELGSRYRVGLCEDQGDTECAIGHLEARLATDKDEEDRIAMQWRIALHKEQWTQALVLLEHSMELARERGSVFYLNWLNLTAGYAADRLERIEQRDAYLAEVLARAEDHYREGSRVQYLFVYRAYAYAIMGDARRCHEALAEAIAQGFRDLPEIRHMGFFDKVLDDPAIKQLLAELEASNKLELQAMHLVDKN